jgi:hypothetical protein
VANKLLDYKEPTPLIDVNNAMAVAVDTKVITISDTKGLKPVYEDENLGTNEMTMASVGRRNVQYILDDDILTFSEVTV